MRTRLFLLSLVLVLVLSLSLMTSCEKNPAIPPSESGSPSDSVSDSSQPDGPENVLPDAEVHNIIENGVPKYNLIRLDSASKNMTAYCTELFNHLNTMADGFFNFDTDYSIEYIQTGSHDPSTFEIVVGNTNYEQSSQVMKDLTFGEYAIEVVGNKIILAAHCDSGIKKAINEFTKCITNAYDADTKTLTLQKSELEQRAVYDENLNFLTSYGESRLDLEMDTGDSTKMLKLLNTKPEDMNECISKLQEKGMKLHTSNDTERTKAATLVNDKIAISFFFADSDDSTRIFIDDLSVVSAPTYERDYTDAEKICDTKLIQIGTTPSDNDAQNGECYLIRLPDGRFVIYDGGFSGNESGATPRNNAKRIYETLLEYTPGEMTPTVAAWYITHAHGDHNGAYKTFMKTYAGRVTVEELAINYPIENIDDADWGNRENDIILFRQYFPNGKFVKLHPGHVSRYADVEIEVLYTIELFYPKKFDYFNTSSTVTRVKACGQTIMMSGDMSPDGNSILRTIYSGELKSDFYQVSHHGGNGGSDAFNKLCDPRWVLWPRGDSEWGRVMGLDRNSYLTASDTKVEIMFPAWFQTTVINLPFDGTEAGYVIYPNK